MKLAFTFTSHSRPASRSQPASQPASAPYQLWITFSTKFLPEVQNRQLLHMHCFKHSIPESNRPASQPACEPTSQSNIFAGRVTTSAYQNAFEI
jgi:hypothetical protein